MTIPRACRWLSALLMCLGSAAVVHAQITSTVAGTVADEQGAVLPGATVLVRHAASGLERATASDGAGRFTVPNLPVGLYDVSVALDGFAAFAGPLRLEPTAAADLHVTLSLASLSDTVVVTPVQATLDVETAGTRHAVSVTRIERLPAAVSSRGIEGVLVSFPGFAQNANGAIHPRGAHNQMTFVIDSLPISDQLTGAFANALDVGVVQTAEVMTGNIPAEFGGKVSGVAILNSRSGLGVGRPFSGAIAATAGGFGTTQGALQGGGERGRFGYFASATTLRTDRFLDQVSLDNLHNHGAFGRGFGRIDLRLSARDTLRLHVMGGRSAFDLANLRSQQAAGQDQRQALADVSSWVSYARSVSATSTVEATGGVRTTAARLHGSPGDTPVTASQDRRLSTFTTSLRYTRQRGAMTMRGGVDVQHFPVREAFTLALTSPSFNVPGTRTYNDALAEHDLTRGGQPFTFDDARAGSHVGAFTQVIVPVSHVTVNAGLRHDEYHFLVTGRQLQPRVGLSYRPGGRGVVLRASYNRTFQTPPNENLLLSSSDAASRLAPASVRAAFGGGRRPIRPERQHVLEGGVQLLVRGVATVDAAVYRKWSRDQQDNNNFFDSGVIFPTALARLDARGAEVRVTLLPRKGVSGTLSATTAKAIATPPFTGGLFLGQDAVDLLSAGPFAIDHDQRLSVHGTMTFDPPGPWWAGLSARYDSGLVANPSDPVAVAASGDFADLLPYVDLAAATPRVRPRTVVDLTTGADWSGAHRRKTWSVQAQVTNLANAVALYNFQSVFVGTRVVQPRTASLRVTRYF